MLLIVSAQERQQGATRVACLLANLAGAGVVLGGGEGGVPGWGVGESVGVLACGTVWDWDVAVRLQPRPHP